MEKQILTDAMETFRIEAESLAETAKVLDAEAFGRAVEVLSKAPRIAAAGCGHTGIACRHFAHLMCCIERPARFLSPAEAVHGGMGFLQPGDVMLLASRGGKTDELMPIADICRKKGVTVIAVTENLSSPLAEKADISVVHLSNIEFGKKTPGLSTLIRIAETLDVATDWILRANTPGTYAVANEKIGELLAECTNDEMLSLLRILEEVKNAMRHN